MKFEGLAWAALGASLLAGCGSFVPVVNLRDLPPEQRHAVQSVKILSANQRLDDKAEVLAVVEGHSCKNKVWDAPATRAGAIEQLKFHAREAGANAITNIQCGGREGTSTNTNCWELISCTAEAIKTGDGTK